MIISETEGPFSYEVRINSSTLTMRSNGTYSTTVDIRLFLDGQDQGPSDGANETGTYTVSGSSITLIANDDPQDPQTVADRTTTATFSAGNTISLSELVDHDDDPATADVILSATYRK